jgi:hypothetical protein
MAENMSIPLHTEADLKIRFIGDLVMRTNDQGQQVLVSGNTNVAEKIASLLGVRTGGSRSGVLYVTFYSMTTEETISSENADGHYGAPNENPRAVA